MRTVSKQLGDLDEVEYVVITSGRFDVLAEVVCTGHASSLLDLVNDRIRPIDGVRSVEVFTYLALDQADLQPGALAAAAVEVAVLVVAWPGRALAPCRAPARRRRRPSPPR